MSIGDWVRRDGGKWHRVESVIAGAAITRCGRRMEPEVARAGGLDVVHVEPLTRAIGSVVEGIDLALPLDPTTIETIAGLLAERQVLFFRDQPLDALGQCAFAAQFGTLAVSPLQRLTGSTRRFSITMSRRERHERSQHGSQSILNRSTGSTSRSGQRHQGW
jgi:alpha-ketoglutarate-dependent taurine dioxygenase